MMDSFDKLKHCVKNMINFIYKNNENNNINVSIIFFDNKIETPIIKMMINSEETKEAVISEIDTYECRGATNISEAFKTASELKMVFGIGP